MTRDPCHGAVHVATGGKLSDEEVAALLKQLKHARQRMGARRPDLDDARAWQEVLKEEGVKALKARTIARRTRALALRARTARDKLYAEMGGDPAQMLSAVLVGSERIGHGQGLSTDAIGRALQSELFGDLERGLRDAEAFDRLVNWLGAADRKLEEDWVVEIARLNGGQEKPTGNAVAVKAAEATVRVLRKSRDWQNAAGAWIAELPGYITRQSHDPLRVAGGFWRELRETGAVRGGWSAMREAAAERAFAAWREFTEPLLDPRTFDDVPDRAAFLRAVWEGIVTGRHNVLQGADDVSDLRVPPSTARRVSAERKLHYRDARAWLEYHRRFGARGPVAGAIFQQLARAASNTALMRRFGPNPRAAFDADRARFLKAARTDGKPGSSKALLDAKLDRQFDEVDGSGNAPESLRLATVGRLIRVDQSLSKLGGMVLSAFSDLPLGAQALARSGVPFLDAYQGILAGVARLDGPQGREIADLLDVGARGAAAQLSSRFSAFDGPVGWSAWAMRLFYKVNGFEFWNDGLRQGVAQMLSSHLGAESGKAWAALRPGTRETLTRYAIGDREWELLRKGAASMEDGRRYLTFDAVEAIADADLWALEGLRGKARTPEAAARIRDDLKVRLQALVHDTIDTAVSEGRARERSALSLGQRPGTIAGEAIRLFTQFWSFPFAFMGRHLAPAASGFAGQKPVFLMAHLILATGVLGLVSMQAKQLVKGRSMRPLRDEDGALRGDTVLAALLQGGGLGIYGDFLFGEYNRFGGSVLGTLGGPAVSEVERVFKLFSHLRDGFDPNATPEERADAFGDARTGAVRQVVGNTPFVNLWYTRAALDWALLWRVNEWLSPGWAERYERRVEEETGSEFWLKPTEAVQ